MEMMDVTLIFNVLLSCYRFYQDPIECSIKWQFPWIKL